MAPPKKRPMTWKRLGKVTFHYSYEDETCTQLHIEKYGKTLSAAILLWKQLTDSKQAIWNPVHERFEGKTATEMLTWLESADDYGQTQVTLLTCMDRPDDPKEDSDG